MDLDGAEDWMANQKFLLEQRVTYLQLKNASSNGTVNTYNPNDRTFAQKWRDSKNIVARMTYDVANGLYTLPQQLTSSVTGQQYITNIGGNVYEARGIAGEKQRLNNFVNGATAFIPAAPEMQAVKGFGFVDYVMRMGVNAGDDALRTSSAAASKFFRNGVVNVNEDFLYSTFEFVGKSGKERVLEFGGELVKSGKDLIINSAIYIQGLTNKQAAGELGREGLNALKDLIKKIGKEGDFERVLINYERSPGSSSKNPGSTGQWIINVNE